MTGRAHRPAWDQCAAEPFGQTHLERGNVDNPGPGSAYVTSVTGTCDATDYVLANAP